VSLGLGLPDVAFQTLIIWEEGSFPCSSSMSTPSTSSPLSNPPIVSRLPLHIYFITELSLLNVFEWLHSGRKKDAVISTDNWRTCPARKHIGAYSHKWGFVRVRRSIVSVDSMLSYDAIDQCHDECHNNTAYKSKARNTCRLSRRQQLSVKYVTFVMQK
jgi:hypothetical protein